MFFVSNMSKFWKRLKYTLTQPIEIEKSAINLGYFIGRIAAELMWLAFKFISNIVVPVLLVIENVPVGFAVTFSRKKDGKGGRRSQKSLQINKH